MSTVQLAQMNAHRMKFMKSKSAVSSIDQDSDCQEAGRQPLSCPELNVYQLSGFIKLIKRCYEVHGRVIGAMGVKEYHHDDCN